MEKMEIQDSTLMKELIQQEFGMNIDPVLFEFIQKQVQIELEKDRHKKLTRFHFSLVKFTIKDFN